VYEIFFSIKRTF